MIHLQGDIGWDITLASTIEALKDGDRDLTMLSFGGSLIEGWGIHDYLKTNNSIDTFTAFGMVASSATIIMLAANKRIASPNAKFVIHNPWTMEVGDAKRFEQTAKELREEENRLINFYSNATGKTCDEIKTRMDLNTAMDANEALEYGLITDIINFENMSTEKLNKEVEDKFNKIEQMFNSIKNFFNPKNMVVQSTDGTELEFDSGVDTVEQIAVGQGLKAGGQPASGTFILSDGTTVKAEGGVITEVISPNANNDEMDKLKEENDKLSNEVTALQNKVKEFEAKETEFKNQLTAIKNEFSSFKNQFSNDTPPANTPPVNNDQPKKFTFKRK